MATNLVRVLGVARRGLLTQLVTIGFDLVLLLALLFFQSIVVDLTRSNRSLAAS